MNYFAGEFIGDYMGDASYIAAFCTATFESQSLPLVPPMSGAPFTLTSAGTMQLAKSQLSGTCTYSHRTE